jgi:hypothetical protein
VVAVFAIAVAAAVGIWSGTNEKTEDGVGGPSTTVNVSDLQKSQRPAYYYIVNSPEQETDALALQALAASELAAIGEPQTFESYVINIGTPEGQLLFEAVNAYMHAAWQAGEDFNVQFIDLTR